MALNNNNEEQIAAAVDDENIEAHFNPLVQLEHVAVMTGEENEDALLELEAKLYRFDKEENEWKERGNGPIRVLKHKETEKVRLVMRQLKTLTVCANHVVTLSTSVREHEHNDKSCVWHAVDFADGVVKDECFCIRFRSIDDCKKFKKTMQEVAESQKENRDDTGHPSP